MYGRILGERDMIQVDGSFGEGGGQLLRYSVALAALMGEDIKVYNIRAKRSNPGLRPQHLTAIKFIAQLVNADVEGLEIGSTKIVFRPRTLPKPGTYRIDIGTAGSISLLLQAVMPVILAARGRVDLEIIGGTSVKWSPPIPYIQNVLLPVLSRFGVKAEIKLVRRGFYPEGGGLVRVRTQHSYPLSRITIGSYANIREISGISYVGNLPCHIAERQAKSATLELEKSGFRVKNIKVDCRTPAFSRGSGIVLWAITDQGIAGGDSLGERGKPAEKVGREAARRLIDTLKRGVSIDPHASDNLVIYMALAKGDSMIHTVELTSHAITALKLCEKIIGAEFNYKIDRDRAIIRARGIGYST